MSMIGRKKINELTVKKQAPSLLPKCYICNQHFQGQGGLAAHLEEHQNKLNRTNVEEIQRKTQESFRTRQSSAAKRPGSRPTLKAKQPLVVSSKENTLPQKQMEEQEPEATEEALEEALRESQILLEKIDFLTQVAEDLPERQGPAVAEDEKEEEVTIPNQYQLYLQLRHCPPDFDSQTLILRTSFEDESFENYQEQLRHLRKLLKIAVSPDSVGKINGIGRNIAQDVIRELKVKYDSLAVLQMGGKAEKEKERVTANSNSGEVRYCSVCFSTIGAGSEFMESQYGSAYHRECLEE